MKAERSKGGRERREKVESKYPMVGMGREKETTETLRVREKTNIFALFYLSIFVELGHL